MFNALSEAETAENQRPTAKLGEICCRLMLADSPETVSAAMEMWKQLTYSASEDIWRVEQVLLDPLIARLSVVQKKTRARGSTGALSVCSRR